jgi:single-strand DNA-binding protein
MNITAFTGNLGRDFDVTTTGNGMTIAKNSLGVRRDFKDKQTGQYETDWIPLTVFGKTAEVMSQHLGKGSKVEVVGKLQTNNYTDKDGNKRTSYDVIVNSFGFLDSASNKPKKQNKPVDDDPFENNPDTIDISDDDLPF